MVPWFCSWVGGAQTSTYIPVCVVKSHTVRRAIAQCGFFIVVVGVITFSMGDGCSKNPVNQATAKATLTQMINIVLRRMESDVEVIGHTRPTCQSICLFRSSGRFLLLEHFAGWCPLGSACSVSRSWGFDVFSRFWTRYLNFLHCCIIILIVVSHRRIEIIGPCSKFRWQFALSADC